MNARSRTASSIFLCLFASMLALGANPGSVGHYPAAATTPRYAYVVNEDGSVGIFTVNRTTGQLRANGYALTGQSFPVSGAITPSGKFLYTADVGSSNVSGFKVNAANGSLTAVRGSPFASPGPSYVLAHPSSKFLYALNSPANISAYTINGTTGALTAVAGSPFAAGVGPRSCVTDSAGKFLYIADASAGTVIAYSVHATGSLTPVTGSPFPAGNGASSVKVAGRFLFVSNTNDGTISGFRINAHGSLSAVAGSPFAAGVHPGSVAITPNLQFLYVVDSSTNSVSGFVISNTGALVPLSLSAPTGLVPVNAAIDPGGKFLYIANDSSGDVSTYSIANSGNLTPLPTISSPPTPVSIAISKGVNAVTYKPKFAYVTDSGANGLSAFTVDASTGSLTTVAGSPFATGSTPFGVGTTPRGAFVYVANHGTNTVSGYKITPATGVLTPLPGSPFFAATNPYTAVADSSGRFAYFSDTGAQGLSGFKINSDGTLVSLGGASAPQSAPWTTVIDPTGTYLYVINADYPFSGGGVYGYSIDRTGGTLTALSGSPYAATGNQGLQDLASDPTGRFLYALAPPLIGGSGLSAFRINTAIGNPGGALLPIQSSPYGINGTALAVDPAGHYLVVADNLQNVSVYPIDSNTGAPSTSAVFVISGPSKPTSVRFDPSGKFVYVSGSLQTQNVFAYSFDPSTGTLTVNPAGPFSAGANPWAISMTRSVQ